MNGDDERSNTENIYPTYSGYLLPWLQPILTRVKYDAFESIYDCPDKDIKLPKWSCILNCCS